MRALTLVAVVVLGACSTIVGADFDDLRERPAPNPNAGGSGGSAGGQAGRGGSSAGTGNEAGADGSAGEPGGGGTSAGGTSAGAGGTDPGAAGAGGSPSGGQAGEGGAPAGGNGGGGAGGAGGETCGAAGATNEDAVVVLNEIKGQGSGDDYIELYNVGPGAKDLANYRLSDSNNTFVFPTCTVIPEDGYVLLLLGDLLTPGGPHECFVPNGICFHETWGVSAGGEDVFFRDPSNQMLDTTFYPDEAEAGGLNDGESWSRLPNGTGTFQAGALTPQEANE